MTATTPAASPAVTAAAQHLAAAEAHVAEADRDAAHIEAHAAVLRQRIASADHAKAEIAARRQTGDHRDSDAGDVALIDMDREGLVALLADAEAQAAPLRTAGAGARQAVAHAQQHHQRAQDEAEEAALTAHAASLAGLLAQTLAALGEVARRTGRADGRPTWITKGFYDSVRRQASLAGML